MNLGEKILEWLLENVFPWTVIALVVSIVLASIVMLALYALA